MNLLGEELWGHGGGIPGYVSLVVYSPEKEFSIAVLINQGTEQSHVTNALLEVLLEDLNTGVRELTQSPADDFRLTQNYPNPFNPTTEIRYLLSSTSEVELIIYNQAGQKIKTLVDSKLPAGEHRTRWDATNDAGVRVANGVYLYRLRVGAMVQTRKMVLVR